MSERRSAMWVQGYSPGSLRNLYLWRKPLREHVSEDGVRTVFYGDGSFMKEYPAEVWQRLVDEGRVAPPKITESPLGPKP